MTAPELNGSAVYNVEDDTLRWSPDTRLGPNEYAVTKAAGFNWWRGSQLWVATWTPEREDHLLQFVEAIEHEASPDDPEGRAARFASRARKAESRAEERSRAALEGLPPGGEPVKIGHHSEKRHRRAIERSDQHMRQAVEESSKAAYWRERARGTEARARQKSDPGVIRRRIERLETDLRKVQRQLAAHEAASSGPGYSHRLGRDFTDAEWTALREAAVLRARRWVAHLELRLTFERARLEATGVEVLAPADFTKGEVVQCRWGRAEVVRVGTKNVSVRLLDGPSKGRPSLEEPNRLKKIQPQG